ncbi:AMP-binding protein, partial [Sulfitobacter sp. HI0129]
MIEINPPAPAVPPQETVVARIRANAAAHPNRLALVCGDTRLTWGAFDRRINRVANALIGMGVSKGDTVAVLSANSAAYAEIFMGVLRAGGCVTPLSSMASS